MESKKVSSKYEKNQYRFKTYSLKLLIPKKVAPKGRSGHRIVSNNSYFYSLGGFNPDETEGVGINHNEDDIKLFRELWRFNIATKQWQKLHQYRDSLPEELVSNAVILTGNTLIVHGGTGFPFGDTSSNKTYLTNLSENSSLKLIPTTGQEPAPQYGQAMTIHGNNLYVVGGTTGFIFLMDVHCLNLKTGVWEAIYISKGKSRLEPEGRYRHEVAFYNSRIIVFGGGTTQHHFDFKALPAFNIKTREWEYLQTIGDCSAGNSGFPAARRSHGSVQIPEDDLQDPEFVICGGFDEERTFSDIWKINLKTLQWSKSKLTLPSSLYFHGTSLSPNGQMFIFGGINEIYNDSESVSAIRTNDVFSIWVKIPKLSEMCWDALLHYNPKLTQHSKKNLLMHGIPPNFVDRLP